MGSFLLSAYKPLEGEEEKKSSWIHSKYSYVIILLSFLAKGFPCLSSWNRCFFLLSFATPMVAGNLSTLVWGRWCEERGEVLLAAVGTTQSRWEGLLLLLLCCICACHAMFVPDSTGEPAAKRGFPEWRCSYWGSFLLCLNHSRPLF